MGVRHSRSKPQRTPAQSSSQQTNFLKALSESKIKGKIRTQSSITYEFDIVPWNLRCAPRPLAVVYPLDSQEVSVLVEIAAKYGIPVQPRSGGHSFGSYSLGGRDGALVIDLSEINSVVVDKESWRATIGGGAKLREVTEVLHKEGKRTLPLGTDPRIGIGGHATVGGMGPLSRMHGLVLDCLLEVEVVLADGSITVANSETNPDLFFAMRGAGASFAIATKFIFETHPAPEAVTHYSFQLNYASHHELAKIFLQWQDFVSSPEVANDRAFNSLINITGNIILVQGSRLGTRKELEASEIFVSLNKTFKIDIKTHELDWMSSIVNWAVNAGETLAGALAIPLYVKSWCVRESKPLTEEMVNAWFEYMHKHSPNDSACMIISDLKGARVSDIPNDATAFSTRDSLYNLAAYSLGFKLPYPDDALGYLNGMDDIFDKYMPDGDFGVYPGYVDPLLPKTRWPKKYWGVNYPRLLEIKKKYDPHNVYSNPQSVGADENTLPLKSAFVVDGMKPVLNIEPPVANH